uniref:Uncharacterized protein n=1 Tax=Plectus sambesii TaxID=2011161 RepID=A0A914VN66_9BILA
MSSPSVLPHRRLPTGSCCNERRLSARRLRDIVERFGRVPNPLLARDHTSGNCLSAAAGLSALRHPSRPADRGRHLSSSGAATPKAVGYHGGLASPTTRRAGRARSTRPLGRFRRRRSLVDKGVCNGGDDDGDDKRFSFSTNWDGIGAEPGRRLSAPPTSSYRVICACALQTLEGVFDELFASFIYVAHSERASVYFDYYDSTSVRAAIR